MKKFLANSTTSEIKEIEILRETQSSIYVVNDWHPGGERREKLSETRGYFDSLQEARTFLLEIEEGKIATLTRELARRQANIEKIKELGA